MSARCFLILFCLSTCYSHGQDKLPDQYSILFYNVENLFDCENDSLKLDDEFTFNGNKHWTYNRYKRKLNQISKTILSVNQWNSPVLVGMCEVENQKAINQLIYETGLNNLHYKYIHFESPDRRGIDVALLYKKTEFTPLEAYPLRASEPRENFFTRDILYTKGIIHQQDTLHLFVNHWPSKLGGEIQSELKRIKVARVLKSKTDSILNINKQAYILIIGDFNTDIPSPSIQHIFKNNQFHSLLKPHDLKTARVGGSHKYQGIWSLIDHIFISSGLINNSNLQLEHHIAWLPWHIEEDLSHSGVKPRRTYSGPRYIGGPSDHLPVMLKVTRIKHND